MGQGYSLTTLSAASASIDVPELADLVYEKTLASARFMKSLRARNQQGFVFVKAVMKPYPSFDVQKYVKQILEERNALATISNALGYQRVIEVGSGGFLVRQYINNSVYDRLSTRPFLEDIEKKWLAFQLLCAVRNCHAQNVFHGDIKTENLLVTSWNWLYLADFSSSFKPTILPEDNPADFSFYFDTSGRRTCYLAPERFTTSGVSEGQVGINWAMDIFSVGCTIAEIFLEGPIFTLSQIFKYRSGDYSPEHTHLSKIEDTEVRDMVLNMIDLDPEKRYSAEQALAFYRSKIFPDYFYSFLRQYMYDLTDPSSGRKPVTLDVGNLGESDNKIERVYNDFDKISYFLGYPGSNISRVGAKRPSARSRNGSIVKRVKNVDADTNYYDGTLLFLTIVVSSIRNTAKVSARLKACDLLVSFAERLPDEAKLDRVLPYLAGLLNDSSDIVRVAALRSMTTMLEMVQVVSPINAYVFPEYIFPKLKQFILGPNSQPSTIIRATYASCLASLALSSGRILDMVQAIRADGRLPSMTENDWAPNASYHSLFDVARAELVPHFEEATKALITDPEASVRRAFLGSVSRLCVFFGSLKTSDVILSYLNTYLNDKDWMLKCSFFEALVGVAAYVGSVSVERYILPIMIQSLTDSENFVVEKVFRSLGRMASLGLLQKPTTWELVSIAARFLVHPSLWIRESSVQFIALSSRYISTADKYCIIMPLVQPFLKWKIMDISEELLLDSLKTPLPKAVFDAAVSWAERIEKSAFWDAAKRDSIFVLPDPESPGHPSLIIKRLTMHIPPSQRGKEDQQPLQTLRALGMTRDDEMKLLALREYMYKIAHQRIGDGMSDRQKMLGTIISLNQINVTPQNVFFDNQDPVREIKRSLEIERPQRRNGEPSTITDALLDASTAITDQSSRMQFQIGAVEQNNGLSRSTTAADPALETEVVKSRPEVEPSGGRTPIDIKINGSPAIKLLSSADELSSSNPEHLLVKRNTGLSIRHHNSAINLMNRAESFKADAAVSTSSENVFGKLDGPLQSRRPTEPSPLAMATKLTEKSQAKNSANSSALPLYEPNHSYQGNDPNVLRLLDNHFIENFPIDLLDFGQIRQPIDKKAPIRRENDPGSQANEPQQSESVKYHDEPWHPTGQLLTLYSEHTAAVNRVVAAPDHALFVTASDDGTCKIWDTTRLEKNVTPRSRHTHKHAPGAKVKSLCFVENTHAFISAADDGSIHVVKLDYKSIDGGESTRYGKPSIVRDYQIPTLPNSSGKKGSSSPRTQEYAVWLHHYRTNTFQSILLAATNRHRILAIDLKTMETMYTMSNPIHHGTPTTFCVDKKHHWLLLATSHGILDLWDLRFRLHLRSLGIQTTARIERVLIHPSRGHGKWVIVSAGGELSVWDVEKAMCREVLRPSSYDVGNRTERKYEAWYPDEEGSEKILDRFAKEVREDQTLVQPQMRPESAPVTPTKAPPTTGQSKQTQSPPLAIPALYLITDHLHNPKTPSNPEKISILFSGGADRTLRYWDISRPELSRIISGPQLNPENVDGTGRIQARYVVEHPLSVSAGGQIAVVTEVIPPTEGGAAVTIGSAKSTPTKRSGKDKDKERARTSTGPSKPPRNTLISSAQQQLLRTHMDGIMDVCVLRRPYGCVVSVDRAGCVFVFQ
jgi:phosphoinositide-3-kinase, regulatory subunit 4